MKTALVTGVSTGIGRATAALFAKRGFRTFGTVRNDTPPESGVEFVRLDVRDEESVRSAVATVVERAGTIDVLVNNAGVTIVAAIEETSIDQARDLFETNLFGVLRMTQAVLPVMRKQRSGRIINISSVAGFMPTPFMGVYCSSKHALEGLSASLDHEVRGFGIHISLVEPGFVRTNIGNNAHGARAPLAAYEPDHKRADPALARNLEQGIDADEVARVVVNAATARSPRLRYQAGRSARFMRVARAIAPEAILDKGVRQVFGL